jgi:hypothetical protein
MTENQNQNARRQWYKPVLYGAVIFAATVFSICGIHECGKRQGMLEQLTIDANMPKTGLNIEIKGDNNTVSASVSSSYAKSEKGNVHIEETKTKAKANSGEIYEGHHRIKKITHANRGTDY